MSREQVRGRNSLALIEPLEVVGQHGVEAVVNGFGWWSWLVVRCQWSVVSWLNPTDN
jgi:hypothetical protein